MVTMFTVQSTDEVEDETHLEECLAEADSLAVLSFWPRLVGGMDQWAVYLIPCL